MRPTFWEWLSVKGEESNKSSLQHNTAPLPPIPSCTPVSFLPGFWVLVVKTFFTRMHFHYIFSYALFSVARQSHCRLGNYILFLFLFLTQRLLSILFHNISNGTWSKLFICRDYQKLKADAFTSQNSYTLSGQDKGKFVITYPSETWGVCSGKKWERRSLG